MFPGSNGATDVSQARQGLVSLSSSLMKPQPDLLNFKT